MTKAQNDISMTNKNSMETFRSYYTYIYSNHRARATSNDVNHHYDQNPMWQHYVHRLKQWISEHHLHDKRVLEVGSGLGILQHLVDDYIGIDIASTAGAYCHKPFMTASATALPFADNSFDGIWSIWVLEHLDEPEQMLQEMARVLKPGGGLFLCAAWDVAPWVAQGYHVRPFRDLTWRGRLTKVTVLPRIMRPYRQLSTLVHRFQRLAKYAKTQGLQPLDYRPLTPNLDTFWDSDADACSAVDSHAVWLWYVKRGFRSEDSTNHLGSLLLRHTEPLRFIKVQTTTSFCS